MRLQSLKGIGGTTFNSYEVNNNSSEYEQQQWLDYSDSPELK